MAMTIAVVDDDDRQKEYLIKLIKKWADSRSIAADVCGYGSAEAFLFDYEGKPVNLLLLDIEMRGQNGMELAKRLRARGDSLPIVFITGFADYMNEGYDVEALHYLLKPLDDEKLVKVLDRYAERKADVAGELVVDTENGSMHLNPAELMYAEAFGRICRLYMHDGRKIDAHAGIGELRERLSTGEFVGCHRSYIVNLRYVRTIGRTCLTLDNGEQIFVSRRLYGEVSKAFTAYYTAKTGGIEL